MMKTTRNPPAPGTDGKGLRAGVSALLASLNALLGRAGRKSPAAPAQAKTLAAAKGDDDLMSTPPR